MNNFSPNMLKTFETCPIKYYLKYIQKISIPQKNSFFEKGKKIHALAHYYLRGDNIDKLEKILNNDETQIWKSLKTNSYFQKTYVNSEYNISCKIDEYWIGGRLDALVKDDNDYYILDYKTGTIPQNPENDFQTIVYLLCTDKIINNYNSLSFVYIDLKNNTNKLVHFDNNKKGLYIEKIKQTCTQLKNVQLPEEIEHSKICNFCEYKQICI